MRLSDFILHQQKKLHAAGVESAALDARLLICHVLGCDRATLLSLSHQGREVSSEDEAKIVALIDRRAAREPVHRILGQREFWGLPFGLNEATLEPRPDSETLIETALDAFAERKPPARLLDIGTGTGCLLLALLHEWQEATGVGVDKSPRAIEQAQSNAHNLSLDHRAEFRESNWLEDVATHFDLIISNPPYIPRAEIDKLDPEVRLHDPMVALDGGEDGLFPYRYLIPQLASFLTPQGIVLFEVGDGQSHSVASLMRLNDFKDISVHQDLGGIARCVMGKRAL